MKRKQIYCPKCSRYVLGVDSEDDGFLCSNCGGKEGKPLPSWVTMPALGAIGLLLAYALVAIMKGH